MINLVQIETIVQAQRLILSIYNIGISFCKASTSNQTCFKIYMWLKFTKLEEMNH